MFLDAGEVTLRPFREEDRKTLIFEVLTRLEVMALAMDERAYSVEEADALIDREFMTLPPQFANSVIEVKETRQVAGFGGYRPCRYLGVSDVEFGWVLALAHQGLGYATALGEKLIVHALECLNLPRILAACNPANVKSERVLRHKLGMTFEKEVEPKPNYRRLVFKASPGWRSPTRTAETGSRSHIGYVR
jgi:RimJ/RimL family protein N-acetyltransferase